MVIKHMEEELNDLALALLKEAEAKKEKDRLAAEAFEAQLLGIAEGDAFALKDPSGVPAEGEGDIGEAGEEGAEEPSMKTSMSRRKARTMAKARRRGSKPHTSLAKPARCPG